MFYGFIVIRSFRELLNHYIIKPLVGIIPDCRDPEMDKYPEDKEFWDQHVSKWIANKWEIAMHGYQHLFHTNNAGINPVNKRSEFAGLPLDEQRRMIRASISILRNYRINPEIFFAPAHTFDKNTLLALKMESDIRAISDTPANDIYRKDGFVIIPQQSGHVRKLPFKTITFCYHPNNMNDEDFDKLDTFIRVHEISDFEVIKTDRKLS